MTPRSASAISARIATASAISPMIVNAKAMPTATAITSMSNSDRVRGIDHRIRLKRDGDRAWILARARLSLAARVRFAGAPPRRRRSPASGDESARAAVVAERARIARELHDVVGHGLSVIVLQLVATLGVQERGDSAAVRERLLGLEALRPYFYERISPTLEALLDAAAANGEMRDDVTTGDPLSAVAKLCVPVPGEGPESSRRMVKLLVEGCAAPELSTRAAMKGHLRPANGTLRTKEGVRFSV